VISPEQEARLDRKVGEALVDQILHEGQGARVALCLRWARRRWRAPLRPCAAWSRVCRWHRRPVLTAWSLPLSLPSPPHVPAPRGLRRCPGAPCDRRRGGCAREHQRRQRAPGGRPAPARLLPGPRPRRHARAPGRGRRGRGARGRCFTRCGEKRARAGWCAAGHFQLANGDSLRRRARVVADALAAGPAHGCGAGRGGCSGGRCYARGRPARLRPAAGAVYTRMHARTRTHARTHTYFCRPTSGLPEELCIHARARARAHARAPNHTHSHSHTHVYTLAN